MRRNREIAAILLMAFVASGLFFASGSENAAVGAPLPRRRVPYGKSILQGKIVLKGDAPNVTALTKKVRNAIAMRSYFLDGEEFESSQQAYRLGGPKNKQVGNVFVWIAPADGGFFPIDDKQLEEANKRQVVLRMPHGAFIPHCTVLFARYHPDATMPQTRPTGQILKVVNDAPISHNVQWHGKAPKQGGNVLLATEKSLNIENLVAERFPIHFHSAIYPWLSAYVRVFDHPYATVSLAEPAAKKADKNFGTYEIKYVPSGTARVFAWHEKVGWLHKGGSKGEPIQLRDGAITVKDFELEVRNEDR